MDRNISRKLLPFQLAHTLNIVNNLETKGICLDGSDTGIGKTYVAMAAAKQMGMRPFIICPKTIIPNWEAVAVLFNVDPLAIVNYETICRGSYYKDGIKKRVKCPYIEYKKDDKDMFTWKLPKDTLVVFDEVHRCCNEKTLTSKLLMSLQNVYSDDTPLLMLSATIVDNVTLFNTFGLMFKWYTNLNWAPDWLRNKNFNPKRASELIQARLYPEYASRIRISDLGDKFPKRHMTADCYTVEDPDKVDGAYKDLAYAINDLKTKCNSVQKEATLAKLIHARQQIELCKVPLFEDLAQQYIENGCSIVIFVNFTETLRILKERFKTNCVIYGEQTMKERLKNIDDFTENRENVIICNIHAGGEAINLNDKYGGHPRMSLISPTWSSIKLIQALGRTHRSDSKSTAFNRILYCAGTVEQKMCNKINSKLDNLAKINDDDLMN